MLRPAHFRGDFGPRLRLFDVHPPFLVGADRGRGVRHSRGVNRQRQRIVATAMLQQYVSGDAARRFTHNFAGWIMIPFAAALFALALWYMRSLVREEEEMDMRALIRMEDR